MRTFFFDAEGGAVSRLQFDAGVCQHLQLHGGQRQRFRICKDDSRSWTNRVLLLSAGLDFSSSLTFFLLLLNHVLPFCSLVVGRDEETVALDTNGQRYSSTNHTTTKHVKLFRWSG